MDLAHILLMRRAKGLLLRSLGLTISCIIYLFPVSTSPSENTTQTKAFIDLKEIRSQGTHFYTIVLL
mgnify:CR=1 FL=1